MAYGRQRSVRPPEPYGRYSVSGSWNRVVGGHVAVAEIVGQYYNYVRTVPRARRRQTEPSRKSTDKTFDVIVA